MRKMEVFGEALTTLGLDIATQAAQQDADAQSNWDKLKMMLKLAQTLGLEKEAFDALYDAGQKVPQRKALWYRRQKRLIKLAMELDVDISTLSMKDAEAAVLEAREARRSPEDRQADALRMVERTMKGAVNVGKDKEALNLMLGLGTKKARNKHH